MPDELVRAAHFHNSALVSLHYRIRKKVCKEIDKTRGRVL